MSTEPLTADTVTDEQIRELERSLDSAIRGVKQFRRAVACDARKRLESERDLCITALYEHDYPSAKIDARARCAEIINARRAEAPECRHQQCGPGPCRAQEAK